MPCDIESSIAEVIAAYEAKCAECCTPDTDCLSLLPSNQSNLCGDVTGLIREIHAAVTSAASSTPTGCTDWVVDDGYPLPAMGDCLTEAMLTALLAAIIHIDCTSTIDPYYYNACPMQCGTAPDDTIIKTTTANVLVIKYRGVYAYYERAGAVSPTSTPSTDEFVQAIAADCPTEAEKDKICYRGCCQPEEDDGFHWNVNYNECPPYIVLSTDEFDELYPELSGNPDGTCVYFTFTAYPDIGPGELQTCCYCNPTFVANPKNTDGPPDEVRRSNHSNCDDCTDAANYQDLVYPCNCCDYPTAICCQCEPELPALWYLDLNGFGDTYAADTIYKGICEDLNNRSDLILPWYEAGSSDNHCTWKLTIPQTIIFNTGGDDREIETETDITLECSNAISTNAYIFLFINPEWGSALFYWRFKIGPTQMDVCNIDAFNNMPLVTDNPATAGTYVLEPYDDDFAP